MLLKKDKQNIWVNFNIKHYQNMLYLSALDQINKQMSTIFLY